MSLDVLNMTRRSFLSSSIASGLVLTVPGRLFAAAAGPALYRDGVVIDGLGFPGGSSGDEDAALTAGEITDVSTSGLTAAHLTVGTVGSMAPLAAFEKIVRDIARWEAEIDRHADVLARVREVADIAAAKRDGRTGLIYGLQDGVAFEDDLDRLASLRQFGVRVIQPTYNRRNLLGDGVIEPADAGLSRTGVEAIERLNELGILVDLSHCGRHTAADAIAVSKRPVAFTHTGCAALVEHPRHRTDAELRAVAETGGVIGIFIMPYLSRGKQPTAADVIAHLEHALKVAGSDHVTIGTDGMISATELTPAYVAQFRNNVRERKESGIAATFETEDGYLFASDLNSPRRFEALAGMLLARGHDATTVSKVLGGNLVRVFADTWTPEHSS